MTAAKTAPGVVRCMEITNSPTRVNIESLQSPYTCLHQQPETPETCGCKHQLRNGAPSMKHPIESASGTPQEPLPTEVPRDEDHLINPRDHRAEALAAQQGHPKPKPPKHPEPDVRDALLWRARAFQNRAEARAYAAERDLARQEARESHRQVMGMKTAHRQRLAEVERLRAENERLRARLEDNR